MITCSLIIMYIHVMLADHFHYNITRLTLPLVLPFSSAKCTNSYKAHKGMMIYDDNKGTRILFLLTKTKNGPFQHYRTCHHPTNMYKSHFFTNRKSDSEADIIIHIFLPFSPVHTTDTSVHKKTFILFLLCHVIISFPVVVVSLSIFMWDTQELCYFTSDCRTLCTVSS